MRLSRRRRNLCDWAGSRWAIATRGAGYLSGPFPRLLYVQALFEWGADSTDEEHPLEGSGAQVRYVTVRTVDEATRASLTWGLRAALALPPGRDAKLAMFTTK